MLRYGRGASSVLVMFMMIILVVLGALAFTASYANLSLSRRTHAAYADMYALDAAGEGALARVDACLKEAEAMAADYVGSGGYTLQVGGPLDPDAQRLVYGGYTLASSSDAARKTYLEGLLPRVYCYFALSALAPMVEAGEAEVALDPRYDGASALLAPGVPADGALAVSFTVAFADAPGSRRLSCGLDVVCPAYDITPARDYAAVARVDGAASRIRLTSWRHWQLPFEYDAGFEFDSTLTGDDGFDDLQFDGGVITNP